MQKWEYLFIHCHYDDQLLLPRFRNGVEIKDWRRGYEAWEYCNQLGKEGWELVAVDQAGTWFFFKRPLP